MDRERRGESTQRGGGGGGGEGRCEREAGKVGGAAGDVFIDHSAPSADMAATGLFFCWQRHHISTVGVLAHASVSTYACSLAPALQH